MDYFNLGINFIDYVSIFLMQRIKMGENVNFDPKQISPEGDYIRSENSFAVIYPEIFVYSLRNFYWRHRDMDLIEESLGNFI